MECFNTALQHPQQGKDKALVVGLETSLHSALSQLSISVTGTGFSRQSGWPNSAGSTCWPVQLEGIVPSRATRGESWVVGLVALCLQTAVPTLPVLMGRLGIRWVSGYLRMAL